MPSFPRNKVCLSSMGSNPQIVDIEYPRGICSPIFVVQDLPGLFARPSIFKIKYSVYVILSDFMYSLNSNILSFSEDITVPHKSLF